MQPGQGAFDNPAEDAEAAAMRTAGLGGPSTLPAPWTPRTHPPPSLLVMTLQCSADCCLQNQGSVFSDQDEGLAEQGRKKIWLWSLRGNAWVIDQELYLGHDESEMAPGESGLVRGFRSLVE